MADNHGISEKELNAILDRLVKGKAPEEIMGQDGLVKDLTRRLVEGRIGKSRVWVAKTQSTHRTGARMTQGPSLCGSELRPATGRTRGGSSRWPARMVVGRSRTQQARLVTCMRRFPSLRKSGCQAARRRV